MAQEGDTSRSPPEREPEPGCPRKTPAGGGGGV